MKFQLLAIGFLLLSPSVRAQQVLPGGDNRIVFTAPVIQPAPPRPTGLADVVRARFPLSVEFADLGAGWRELSYGGETYFTKGEATWVNDAEMLIAYKFDASLSENGARTERELIGRLSGSRRSFEPGDRFALSLLPLRSVASYVSNGQTGLRSFSSSRFRVAFDPPLESPAYRQNLTVLYLQQVARAVEEYGRKYLSTTPPLDSAFAARQALLPFVESERVFFVPGTQVPFRANPALGGKKREHLRRRRSAVMFYQASPAEDGLRAVLLFSGQVRRVDDKSWRRLAEASGVS